MDKSKKVKHYLVGQSYWDVFVIDKNKTVSEACKPVSYTHLTLPTNREV